MLAFYLQYLKTFSLAFYLAYFKTFSLALYLAYILIVYLDMKSGILSGSISGIMAYILTLYLA